MFLTLYEFLFFFFFFSSRRRHTRSKRDWSSDVCSSDLAETSQQHGRSQHQGQDCPQRRRHCGAGRSEEHTSELQSRFDLVCRLLLEKKKTKKRGSEHAQRQSERTDDPLCRP